MSREDLLPAINQVLEKPEFRNRHTLFQLRYFVIGKEPTVQARLRKCLAELSARQETIENLRLSIAEARDDIELADIDIKRAEEARSGTLSPFGIDNEPSELDKKAWDIQIRKGQRRKQNLEKTLKRLGKTLQEAEEEAEFFLQAYQELEKVEPLKPYDDPQTNIEYWNERYTEEVKLRLLLQKPIDLELAKCLLAMDEKTPIRGQFIDILNQIEKQQKLAIEESKRLPTSQARKDG
jgi:hypothetical protein